MAKSTTRMRMGYKIEFLYKIESEGIEINETI